jgi:hypothetical protein
VTDWPKKTIEWQNGNDAYISTVFTWDLQQAFSRCVHYKSLGYTVHAGGPAVSLMPDMFKGVAVTGEVIEALPRHNQDATFTSRGCFRQCPPCAVWRIEGDLRELPLWKPAPIVCDNQLFGCSRVHFDKVIDSLMLVPQVDMNQGLDCRIINSHHIDRLRDLDLSYIRFSWDTMNEEADVMNAIGQVTAAGFAKSKIRVYVLFGYKDTPEDALYRFNTLKQMGITMNPMRYQPLDTMVKDSYVAPGWTAKELKRYQGYWSMQRWFGAIPFNEFKDRRRKHNEKVSGRSNVLL